ncbi:MAG: ATP-binding protein [Treponema sp.]|nr:ATP-binding protein [Treponema sp.]
MSFLGISVVNSTVQRYNSLVSATLARLHHINEANEAFTMIRRINSSLMITHHEEGFYSVMDLSTEFYVSKRNFLEALSGYRQLVLVDERLREEEQEFRLYVLYTIEAYYEEYVKLAGIILEAVENHNNAFIREAYLHSLPLAMSINSRLRMLKDLVSLRAERETAEVTLYAGRITNIIAAAAFGLVLLMFLLLFFTAKTIRNPIEKLQHATAQIAGGNLHYPIRSSSQDEIGVLSNDIADMVDSISEMNKTVTIMEHLDTMICVVDKNFDIVYANKSMTQTYGFDPNLSSDKKCYRILLKGDRPCDSCCSSLTEAGGTQLAICDCKPGCFFDEKLGRWLEMRHGTIRWIDGSPAYFHCLTDITERKNSQDRQAQYEEQLREAAKAAQVASIAKSSFIANTSHEIRTPMNSIVGYSELALDDNISGKTREYLTKILDNSKLLLQIINNILDISKIESGKLELEKIPFDMHEIFTHAHTTIMPLAQEKNLMLHFYAEPIVDKMLLGDPTRLTQVLINLLSNAVKFTHSGMIKVSSVIEANTEDSYTLGFDIRDSGIGMTKEEIDKIFQPFSQADASFTRKYGGTGLGLPITKRLVNAMGGELHVESVPRIGSMFSFSLTFKTIEVPSNKRVFSKPIVGQIPKPQFEGEVLICEDSVMNQGVICEHIEKVGLRPTVAKNGKEGVEIVKERLKNGGKPFGLIFMDIHMPIMDGIEAASIIEKLNTGTPIVAMTANVMINDQESYKASGMKETVSKPFTSQVLWRCLLKYFTPISWLSGDNSRIIEEDEKFKIKLMSQFITSNRDICNEIQAAVSSGDTAHAHRLAHNLKNHAGIIERQKLLRIAAEVERQLKNGDTPDKTEMDALRAELDLVLAELLPIVNSAEAVQSLSNLPPLDKENTAILINELEPLLADGNIKYLDYVDALRMLPGSEQLIVLMENINTAEAAEELAEMKKKWT